MVYAKRGILVRLIYLCVSILFFIIARVRGKRAFGILVLCYHGVKNSQKMAFESQLSVIKNRVVGSKIFTSNIESHPQQLLICLTFDDAFANLLTNVVPTITEIQIPVTIFVPTGDLGKCPSWLQEYGHTDSDELVMSFAQIQALSKNKMVSFGSHTVDHLRLSFLEKEEIRDQIRISRVCISDVTGDDITELALPHGDYSQVVLNVAREEGYRNVYSLEPLICNTVDGYDGALIGRFSVSPDDWPIEFYLTVNGAYAWLYPWRTLLRKFRN